MQCNEGYGARVSQSRMRVGCTLFLKQEEHSLLVTYHYISPWYISSVRFAQGTISCEQQRSIPSGSSFRLANATHSFPQHCRELVRQDIQTILPLNTSCYCYTNRLSLPPCYIIRQTLLVINLLNIPHNKRRQKMSSNSYSVFPQ